MNHDEPTGIYEGPERRRMQTGAFMAPTPVEVQVESSSWSWPRLLAQYGLGTLIVIWAMLWLAPRLLERWDEHEKSSMQLAQSNHEVAKQTAETLADLAKTARSIDEHLYRRSR